MLIIEDDVRFAAILRSPHPHARIERLDVARALALPGVRGIVTGKEVADLIEGFFTPSSTDAHNREIIISDYDEEPEMLESDIRQT